MEFGYLHMFFLCVLHRDEALFYWLVRPANISLFQISWLTRESYGFVSLMQQRSEHCWGFTLVLDIIFHMQMDQYSSQCFPLLHSMLCLNAVASIL